MQNTAVVILNYNGRHWLEKFLPSVIRFSGGAQIIVADNASTDDSITFLEKNFPSVQLIAISSNLGFCGGYNHALKQVRATYYVLLNSDVEVTENWIQPVVELLDKNPRVAAVQPKILSYNERDAFEYAGACGGFIDMLGYPFCRGRIFNQTEKDNHQYDDVREVFWATGACLFVRAENFHQMGGLDEDFFAHMEEIDLCWRLQRAGYSIMCQPSSVVYHVGGGTLAASNPKKTYYNFRNGLSLIFKNMPFSQLAWKFPLRIFLDWLAALTFLLNGSGPDALAVLKAHADFCKRLQNEIRKRRTLNIYPYLQGSSVVYKGMLIWNYYALNKKIFKDLNIEKGQ